MNSYYDIEQIMQHLYAQGAELLRHAKVLEKNGISLQQLEAEVGKASHLEIYAEKLSTDSPATTA